MEQVQPTDLDEFRSRPFSLTAEEPGNLPATLAAEPVSVHAWVTYPALASNVRHRALAWVRRYAEAIATCQE